MEGKREREKKFESNLISFVTKHTITKMKEKKQSLEWFECWAQNFIFIYFIFYFLVEIKIIDSSIKLVGEEC